MCKAPLHLLPNPSKPFEVQINASDHAIRVVLYQDGKLVAFETKKLDSTQCCYTIQENELVCSYVLEIFL